MTAVLKSERVAGNMRGTGIIQKILSYSSLYISFTAVVVVFMVSGIYVETLKPYVAVSAWIFLISAGFTIFCESGLRPLIKGTLTFDYLSGINFSFHPVIIKFVSILSLLTGFGAILIGIIFLFL